MTKLLIAVLSLSALGYLAYRTMYGRAAAPSDESPKQQLENVRGAAKNIEQNDEQRLQDIDKKTQQE
jgi:hypothetical protein